MSKMHLVTEEMRARAASIGVQNDSIRGKQDEILRVFENMGRDFSGKIPGLMTQHILAMNGDFKAVYDILSEYKEFIVNSAGSYEWTESELARAASALGA